MFPLVTVKSSDAEAAEAKIASDYRVSAFEIVQKSNLCLNVFCHDKK